LDCRQFRQNHVGITTTKTLGILAPEFLRRRCIETRYWVSKRVSKHTNSKTTTIYN